MERPDSPATAFDRAIHASAWEIYEKRAKARKFALVWLPDHRAWIVGSWPADMDWGNIDHIRGYKAAASLAWDMTCAL